MSLPPHKTLTLMLEAATPICHGDVGVGASSSTNLQTFMRHRRLLSNGNIASVPAISGNAMRHVLIRAPLMRAMLSRLGVERESLPLAVAQLLFSGGEILGGAVEPATSGALSRRVRELYPPLAMLGGAVDAFLLPPGSLRVTPVLMCEEERPAIEAVLNRKYLADLPSAFDLVGEETRTRSGGAKMLYSYETLAAGSRILLELSLTRDEDMGMALLSVALEEWDLFFGGHSRQGRGRLTVDLDQSEWMRESSILEPWLDHCAEHAQAMRDGLASGTLGTDRVLCKP